MCKWAGPVPRQGIYSRTVPAVRGCGWADLEDMRWKNQPHDLCNGLGQEEIATLVLVPCPLPQQVGKLGILILPFTGTALGIAGPRQLTPLTRHRWFGSVSMCGRTGPTLNRPYGGMEQEKMIPTSPPPRPALGERVDPEVRRSEKLTLSLTGSSTWEIRHYTSTCQATQ